jgi:hypothetical protein
MMAQLLSADLTPAVERIAAVQGRLPWFASWAVFLRVVTQFFFVFLCLRSEG